MSQIDERSQGMARVINEIVTMPVQKYIPPYIVTDNGS
jgi:hypothetical protein